jgi:hypothetical protein
MAKVIMMVMFAVFAVNIMNATSTSVDIARINTYSPAMALHGRQIIEPTTKPGLGGWVQNVVATGGAPAAMPQTTAYTPSATRFGDSQTGATRPIVRFGW